MYLWKSLREIKKIYAIEYRLTFLNESNDRIAFFSKIYLKWERDIPRELFYNKFSHPPFYFASKDFLEREVKSLFPKWYQYADYTFDLMKIYELNKKGLLIPLFQIAHEHINPIITTEYTLNTSTGRFQPIITFAGLQQWQKEG